MTTAITLRPAARTSDRRRHWWRRSHDGTVAPAADVEFTWANRQPGTVGFERWLATVGQRLDQDGLAACAHDVDNVVGTARRLGVAPVASAVLADPSEPEPARLRAFAAVASALAGR
jgi:hypothetical protein